MSTLHVENLIGLSSGGNANKIIVPSGQTLDASNGFISPNGYVLQVKRGFDGSTVTVNNAETSGASVTLNRLDASSNFIITVQAAVVRPATSGWHSMGYKVNSGSSVLYNAKDDNSWVTMALTFEETSLTDAVGASLTFTARQQTSVAQNDQFKNSVIVVMEIAA